MLFRPSVHSIASRTIVPILPMQYDISKPGLVCFAHGTAQSVSIADGPHHTQDTIMRSQQAPWDVAVTQKVKSHIEEYKRGMGNGADRTASIRNHQRNLGMLTNAASLAVTTLAAAATLTLASLCRAGAVLVVGAHGLVALAAICALLALSYAAMICRIMRDDRHLAHDAQQVADSTFYIDHLQQHMQHAVHHNASLAAVA